MGNDRSKILKLLETADNFVKYAAPGREERGVKRARKRYQDAATLALRIGDEELHARATLRLQDLERKVDPSETADVGLDDDPSGNGRVMGLSSLPQVDSKLPEHAADRVPPGQRVTSRWPVLHEGPIPRFDPAEWRFTIGGLTQRPVELDYENLKALGPIEMHSDIHCVTGWTKLDNIWSGVPTKKLLELAGPKPEANFVSVGASFGYTANLPLAVLHEADSILAWSHNGEDLKPKHGYPLRLVVPKLYFWKSVKWVRSFELLDSDRRGFWEMRGYHNEADPWREERYSYQER
ncbi:MAG: hypothetical protein QOH90_1041 [Actinomycetota bacterium]|jgi:DMSO/TMAO reductase YedYZ molybdopterin-dependent catalytic subunit|nr:hypothetical protein [Actinomycetota bacterium]